MKQKIDHFNNIIARKTHKVSSRWSEKYWHSSPFGTSPQSNKDMYLSLWEKEKKNHYPEIDKIEENTGLSIEKEWFHDLALHTQIVIKNSSICYQHGRVLYSYLSSYIKTLNNKNCPINVYETGTARGFSAIVMAKCLADNEQFGKIFTFDILPHNKKMYWNSIGDHLNGKMSRKEMIEPWKDLSESYVCYIEGDSRISLNRTECGRIHFAFLDGAHSYKDVLYEFDIIQRRQVSGDVIIFDDYNIEDFSGLVKAVDYGCNNWGYDKHIVQGKNNRNYVLASRK